jgi:drug/metabolite transporter (DMT)-like permease
MKTWQADLLILLGGAIWGLSFIFSRWGLESCSPALFLFLRFTLAALVTWLLFRRRIRRSSRLDIRRGLLLGVMMGVGYLLQTYSLNFTDVTRASFLTGMCLLGIPILSFALFRELISVYSLIGVAMAVVGLYVFLDPSFAGLRSGDVMGLVAIPFWALYMIYLVRFTSGKEGWDATCQYMFWQLAGVMPVALLSALLLESGLLGDIHPDLSKGLTVAPKFLAGLVFNAVLASVITVLLHTHSQRHTTAIQAMICLQAEPITATATAILLLGEPFNYHVAVGGAIILAAIIVSEAGSLMSAAKRERAGGQDAADSPKA